MLGAEVAGSGVTDFQVLGHGYWMLKLWVVESQICRGSGGLGLGKTGIFALGCCGFCASGSSKMKWPMEA